MNFDSFHSHPDAELSSPKKRARLNSDPQKTPVARFL